MQKNKAKTRFFKVLLLLFLVFLMIASWRIWLPLGGLILLVKDNPQRADCIVPLRGDAYFRFAKAVQLYNQGYAGAILVSATPEREGQLKDYYNFNYKVLGIEPLSGRELTLKIFSYFGKDSRDIYFTEDEITSTYDEAVATRKFMEKKGFKSLILVSSTYSMRRALLIFKLVFRNSGIKIYPCTAENKLYNPGGWWRKERDVEKILREYSAIVYNILYHFLLRKARTAFDTY